MVSVKIVLEVYIDAFAPQVLLVLDVKLDKLCVKVIRALILALVFKIHQQDSNGLILYDKF